MVAGLEIPLHDVQRRLNIDNPWWRARQGIDTEEDNWPRRAYFSQFAMLALDTAVKRAVVLIGPRRVGKTVMLKHRLTRTPLVTTRTYAGNAMVDGMTIEFIPVALHCYTIARNLLRGI